jgi:hypothetical protein
MHFRRGQCGVMIQRTGRRKAEPFGNSNLLVPIIYSAQSNPLALALLS